MSTIYDKTDNYGLNLYGDNDPADLRDGYNGSMHAIDDALKNHLDRIDGVESRETHDEEVVKALIGDNTVTAATAAKAKWEEPIAHDGSLKGDGTSADPLKVNLGGVSVADATDNAVYPKLTRNKTTGEINGIAFNAGNGLTAFNSDDPATGSGVRLSDAVNDFIGKSHDGGKSNPVFYGADVTGNTACDDAIAKAIANNNSGITFTDGIYKIMRPIEIPYNTGHPFNVTLSEGAEIVAGAQMDAMLKVGVVDRGVALAREGFKITGGHYDAGYLANTAIFVSKNVSQSIVSDIDIKNITGNGIIIDANNPQTSSNSIVSDIIVNRVTTPLQHNETVGINFIGCDNAISDCYICQTQYGIKSGGLLQASNLHLFIDESWKDFQTAAIRGTEGVFTNIYIDSYKTGFDMTGLIQADTIFVYNYFEDEDRYIFKCVDGKLHVTNVQNSGHKSNYILNQTENRTPDDHAVGFTYDIGNVVPNYHPTKNDWCDFISGNGVNRTYYLTQIPAGDQNSGVLLGYLTRQEQNVVGYINAIISPVRGFEFLFDGPISGDTIFDKTNNGDFGLLLGSDVQAPWNGNLTVAPLYLYHRKPKAYAVDVQITFKVMHYLGFFAKPGRTLIDVTTVGRKNTSNDSDAL